MTHFERAIEIVLQSEGRYSNDPRDPGGETNYGISDRRDGKIDGLVDVTGNGAGDVPVADLTREQAIVIYKREYWDKLRLDEMPWPINLYVFDTAVNQGLSVAPRILQKALGVPQDGVLGRVTMSALERANTTHLAFLIMADRALRYTGTRNFDTYGRGWLKRLFEVAYKGQQC